MSLQGTRWEMTLAPHNVEEAFTRFYFRVETHNMTTGRIEANITKADGSSTTVTVPLRKAIGLPLPNTNPQAFRLSFILKLGGLTAFVSGIVTGAETSRVFNGSYTGTAFDDPGDTGTGTGQQTT